MVSLVMLAVPPDTMSTPLRVLISGAAGQIAYSLIPMVANGSVFGPNQPVILHLLDITPMMGKLKGVAMEIDDCGFPLVRGGARLAVPNPRVQSHSTHLLYVLCCL